jgi:predicted nucleotidyltransferase component of viral defense system
MKDHLKRLVERAANVEEGWSICREYLQARLLQELQRAGAMTRIAFHGGTALRFLYAIPRYSEDLDFALEDESDGYDLKAWLSTAAANLRAEDYDVEVKLSTARVVHSAFVRFRGLPAELGLSGHTHQVLAIKIEVDTKPPAGAVTETTIVRRHVLLNLYHHDSASLLAKKLHAVLQRDYVKGRDLYDLLWYLADPNWPAPNLTLLGNALKQSRYDGNLPTPSTWKSVLAERLQTLDWSAVQADVAPFLQDPNELKILTKEHLLRLLGA